MIKQALIYILFWIVSWTLKGVCDWGIKHSKTTENTFDDWFFAKLKIFVTFITDTFINKLKK